MEESVMLGCVRTTTARWGALMAACLAFVWACTVLNPLDEYGSGSHRDAAPPPAKDAAGQGQECTSARWPGRPANDGPSIEDLVFATETIDIGITGYDLDGVCTCPGPPSCMAPAGSKPHCDLPHGIDNGGSDLFHALLAVTAESDKVDINQHLALGDYGVVVRVREYDGKPDDAHVEVAIFTSGGTEGAQTGSPTPPKHDGSDAWTVTPQSFVDTNAYVANGTLVAAVDFPLELGAFRLSLHGSVFTAVLKKDAQGYRLEDGRLAGRWPTLELLTGLDTLGDPFDGDAGGGLCGASSTYRTIKEQICTSVDIAADPKQDNTSAPCDALSMTVGFTAGPARLGSVYEAPAKTRLCGTSWIDDCSR
jgi:hypothetical protein